MSLGAQSVAEEECQWYDAACKLRNGVQDAVAGGASDALEAIADAVTAALISTIAELGTLWTTIDAPDLTTAATGSAEAPAGGAFNDQVGTLLGYMTWIGMGISAISIILLAITLVTNARRGDGSDLVNKATLLFGATALIGGATSLAGFIVPQRAASSAPAVGFIQDQTFYLTLALAALSMVVAGVRIVWTQRGEPAQELLKGLLTLAIVTASGVALLNVLLKATDALAKQIIDAGIGENFQSDVQILLGIAPGAGEAAVFLGGNQMLIIIGGIIAVCINIAQIMLMVLRTAMLFLIAGVLPLSAAFMNTETGKTWFSKIVAWTLAFAFYKPAAALIYATGITLTTSGLFSGQGLLQFSAGLILIIASVVALPVLIGFLSPALGAMSSSGGGGNAMGMAALGAAIPQGASRLARSRQGFGSTPTPQQGPSSQGGPPSPGGPSSGGAEGASSSGSAGSGAGAGGAAKAVPAAGAAVAAAEVAKKGGEAVAGAVQEEARQGSSGGAQGGSGNPATSSPAAAGESGAEWSGAGSAPGGGGGTSPPGVRAAGGAAGIAGAALQQGAAQVQKQAQQMKKEISSTTGNEDGPNGANRS
ncbi:hypothetical protein P4U43_06485 [Arthrobacter sp. EH-1B-1]|uniref:TrbL/VirB6 plasmid conjugal transfer protein n=1 Tax=Arthrobacter vasquezii TaxID=2977629 RepID=A0ABT6CWN5_9MICC|nr:hypothetical protein [Arthrobacter vasquezii]MDF9277439.1 hypothetical protein [Arthrobacter vasquezii]